MAQPVRKDQYEYRDPPTNDRSPTHVRNENHTNVVEGSLWMIGISLVLFFIPAINGFIGGLVGGYRIGSVGKALVAAILPAIVVSIGLWIILAMLEAPVIGFVAGAAVAIIVLLADIGIFLGAALGGYMGRR